jgi:hypothetical protein
MNDLRLTTGNVTFVGVDGATNDYDPISSESLSYKGTVENTLDLVCVAGMVPSANIVLYKGLNSGVYFDTDANTANALNSNSSFGNAIQRAVDDNCDVITISWGGSEQGTRNGLTAYCGDYLAAPLANAAAKNISVFVASGDYGSQAIKSSNPAFQIVSADYPATNANVVSVGGTYLTLYSNNIRFNETVYNNSEPWTEKGFGGGGGVSSVIPVPSYQANLTYKTHPENSTKALTTRGVPDIAAAMNAYGMWLNGNVTGVNGTSASAPNMAGMIARFISLNGGRRPPGGAAGLNTIFYQNPGSFFDIRTGNNASLLPTGYSATPGWDATIGLGAQANATQTYQSVTSAGIRVKNKNGVWQPIRKIQYKTDNNNWVPVNKVWVKVNDTDWKQTY